MNKVFLLISLSLMCVSNFVFGATAPTCGFTKQCPDGLACVGATGTTSNGVCVLTGPQVALCKTVLYFDKNLVSTFAIFAIVMIGLAFFLGKISWGMIISVLLGIAIAKGATTIIKKVSGQEEGYCTSEIIDYSTLINKNGTAECVSQINKIANTPYVYNLSDKGVGTVCVDPLSCYKQKCAVPATSAGITLYVVINSTFTGYSVSVDSDSAVELFAPPSASIIFTTATTGADYTKGGSGIISASALACIPVPATPNQDYFSCNNTCTNTKFGHVYDVGKYADCKAIVAAQ